MGATASVIDPTDLNTLVPAATEGINDFKIENWQYLSPHHLFNKINESQPLKIIDLRQTSTEFETIHIKGSVHVISSAALVEKLRSLLFTSKYNIQEEAIRGLKCFVFLLPSNVTEDYKKEVYNLFKTEIEKLGGKWSTKGKPFDGPADQFRVEVYLQESCEVFFSMYKDCSLIVESGPVPESDGNTPTTADAVRMHHYPTEIIPNFLYLGDYTNGRDASQLAALKITHLIDVTNQHWSEEVATAAQISYLPIDIWDLETVDIKSFFPQVNDFIGAIHSKDTMEHERNMFLKPYSTATLSNMASLVDKYPSRVLLHCRAGWSRSAALLIAYLMQRYNINLSVATKLIVEQRPFVCPNEGFRTQLIAYEQERLQAAQQTTPSHLDSEDDSVEYSMKKVCASSDALRQTILDASCLITENLTLETDYDRIPISVINSKNQLKMDALEQENDPNALDEDGKPKKAFLKRGEGKIAIPKRPVSKAGTRKKSSNRYSSLSTSNSTPALNDFLAANSAFGNNEDILIVTSARTTVSDENNNVDSGLISSRSNIENVSPQQVQAPSTSPRGTVNKGAGGIAASAGIATEST